MDKSLHILLISIHSLVKRETSNASLLSCMWAISIHSLVKRETVCHFRLAVGRNHFNPLPRKEGDGISQCLLRTIYHFNPLPRKEGDALEDYKQKHEEISIRSLVKRETANFAKIWLNRILILCTFLLEHKKF